MKRWIALAVALIGLLIGFFILGSTAVDPELFTGEWYSAADGKLYHFSEGVITCTDRTQKGADFCGAYFFCGNRILLFTVDPSGVSQLRELYPGGEPRGEFLCESAAGSGRIYFSRTMLPQDAQTE